jgi:hypothetical protein
MADHSGRKPRKAARKTTAEQQQGERSEPPKQSARRTEPAEPIEPADIAALPALPVPASKAVTLRPDVPTPIEEPEYRNRLSRFQSQCRAFLSGHDDPGGVESLLDAMMNVAIEQTRLAEIAGRLRVVLPFGVEQGLREAEAIPQVAESVAAFVSAVRELRREVKALPEGVAKLLGSWEFMDHQNWPFHVGALTCRLTDWMQPAAHDVLTLEQRREAFVEAVCRWMQEPEAVADDPADVTFKSCLRRSGNPFDALSDLLPNGLEFDINGQVWKTAQELDARICELLRGKFPDVALRFANGVEPFGFCRIPVRWSSFRMTERITREDERSGIVRIEDTEFRTGTIVRDTNWSHAISTMKQLHLSEAGRRLQQLIDGVSRRGPNGDENTHGRNAGSVATNPPVDPNADEHRDALENNGTPEFVDSDYAEPIYKSDLALLFERDRATIARWIESGELRVIPGTPKTAKKVRVHGDDFTDGIKRPHERKAKLSSVKKLKTRQ